MRWSGRRWGGEGEGERRGGKDILFGILAGMVGVKRKAERRPSPPQKSMRKGEREKERVTEKKENKDLLSLVSC